MSAPASGPSPLEAGDLLGRYELLCAIGKGGMATVWLARMRGSHGFEKLVAVKTIAADYAADPQFRKMLLDEARIATRIDHPNVVHVLDFGEERDWLYLVMDYVAGESLHQMRRVLAQKSERIPLPIALRIICDTCAGLHAAHELRDGDGSLLGVVHRDVSPQNIVVSESGIVKLVDFGVAKAKGRISDDTTTGLVKGKLRYMAPEQAMGTSIDRRADVFAVGLVAYELIEGESAFGGSNEVQRLHELVGGGPIRPFATNVPPAIAAVVMKALSRNAGERYPTAAELRIALEDAMLASSLRAGSDDIAGLCEAHLGARTQARRDVIRDALARAVKSVDADPTRVSTPALPLLESREGRTRISVWLALLLLLLVGVAFVYRAAHPNSSATASPSAEAGGKPPPAASSPSSPPPPIPDPAPVEQAAVQPVATGAPSARSVGGAGAKRRLPVRKSVTKSPAVPDDDTIQ